MKWKGRARSSNSMHQGILLAITISLGIATGLSIGLHSMKGRGPQI